MAGKHVVQPSVDTISQAVQHGKLSSEFRVRTVDRVGPIGYGFIALGTDMFHIQQGAELALAAVVA